jgi:hypothetical protein
MAYHILIAYRGYSPRGFASQLFLQYLPKVWKRARARENHMAFSFFSRRSEKSNFRRIAMNFFLAVAIRSSNKLNFFQIFPTKGRVGLKWIPKFGNTL